MWQYIIVLALGFCLGECFPNIRNNDINMMKTMGDRNALKKSLQAEAEARQLGSVYPEYPSCDVDWTFGLDCPEIAIVLANQINQWATNKCNDDASCSNYQLFMSYEDFLYGMHQSADKSQLDLFYLFLDTTPYGCSVWSYSYSTDDMEMLDDGRNFCNVMNIVAGAGLSELPHYSRDTSNARCTQFTTTKCDI